MTAPIRTVAVRWKCPHCTRTRSHKSAIVAHIDQCWRNPANRTCKTCQHYEIFAPDHRWSCPNGPCNCNDWEISCAAGEQDISDGTIRISCANWKAKETTP